jgi:hypothetical protein
MKKYSEFCFSLNENELDPEMFPMDFPASGKGKEKKKALSGRNYVDVVNDDTGVIAYEADRLEILDELELLLSRKEKGFIKNVIVTADIPTQGANKAAYLNDIIIPTKRERTPDDRPEDEEPDDINIFVDTEFEVVGIDRENDKIIGMPVSLRKKGITTPIEPLKVIEIGFTKTNPVEKTTGSLRKLTKTSNKLKGGYYAGFEGAKKQKEDEMKYKDYVAMLKAKEEEKERARIERSKKKKEDKARGYMNPGYPGMEDDTEENED